MGSWNRSRYVSRPRGDVSRRPSYPPLPPPDYGHEHFPVPLWEREFCSYVGNISWKRFCENKQYISIFRNLEQWDDSGALENFQNAKARFWDNYHGQPSDIPLPDPDMYIDKVNQHCKVDPELAAELDKLRLPFDSDDNLSPATGLADAGEENKCTENQTGNWDIYIEKPVEVNNWELKNNAPPNLIWGLEHESSNKWGDNNSGWGDALDNSNWHSLGSNHYLSNNMNNNFCGGGSHNRYQEDPSHTYGRKRNGGGSSQQRNNKQRNQAQGYQRSSWRDHGGRNNEWRPLQGRSCQNGPPIGGGL